jgi:acyl carrier protein
MRQIRRLPPLRGILHAAMVLEDSVLANMTSAQMLSVLGPKAQGAWNLHAASKNMRLEFFVLFSSISSIIGITGQGNYSAANAFLDSFSSFRRAEGLTASAVNGGYLGEVGTVARNPAIAERFNSLGARSFSPQQALEVLARVLEAKPDQVTMVNMDWGRFESFLQPPILRHRFCRLYRNPRGRAADGQAGAPGHGLRRALESAEGEQRLSVLRAALREQVARVLGASADKIDAGKPLTDLGFDSLMAVELRNWVETNLDVVLPTIDVMQGPSIDELAQRLLRGAGGKPNQRAPAAAPEGGRQAAPEVPPQPAGRPASESKAPARLKETDLPEASVVRLKAGGARLPLFLIHPGGGGLATYRDLADAMAADQPVYGIESRALQDVELEHGSLASMAAEYARLIRRIHPAGPYRLMGWSLSGLLAMAVAPKERARQFMEWVCRTGRVRPGAPLDLLERKVALLDWHGILVQSAALPLLRSPLYVWSAQEP